MADKSERKKRWRISRPTDLPAGQSRRPYVKVTTHWV